MQKQPTLFFYLILFIIFSLTVFYSSSASLSPVNIPLPTDAVALLSFKSKADVDNKLLYTLNERFDYCQWQGVKCVQGRVVRFVLQGFGLRGVLLPNTLTRLDQLRVLSLRHNSLAGPIPDLGELPNLRTLFLDHNSFSGTFPPSLPLLHRLISLDLSHNNLSGTVPPDVNSLDRLNYLRLDWNHFNGIVPPLNQSTLEIFNVSVNNFSGPIPVTPTITRFGVSSFFMNPNLCGEILNKVCRSSSPFFDPPVGAASPPTPLLQNAQGVFLSPPSRRKHTSLGVVLGFVIGVLILIAAVLCLVAFFKRQRDENQTESKSQIYNDEAVTTNATETTSNVNVIQLVNTELEVINEKKPRVPQKRDKSGNLIFCTGETPFCNLEQLMRASAELLGRGTIGTTYKAVMDNQLIMSVKRLDASKTAITTGEEFERHMEAVGGLRHPNLVSVRAYFQAQQERLIIYDYQPNGSLFNLIHGSRSTRAKPLHWTSCLKISEDLAMGLSYIHQASNLVHGNLKSSNVLLGPDFEACLTDYCISLVLSDPLSSNDDPDTACYRAPELRKSGVRAATPKSDVYAFGVLLLELLTGKPPSQHPFIVPDDMPEWVRAMRDVDDGEDDRLGSLVEVAGVCSLTSPEQRPAMRQVLKMIQQVKENAMMEENS